MQVIATTKRQTGRGDKGAVIEGYVESWQQLVTFVHNSPQGAKLTFSLGHGKRKTYDSSSLKQPHRLDRARPKLDKWKGGE